MGEKRNRKFVDSSLERDGSNHRFLPAAAGFPRRSLMRAVERVVDAEHDCEPFHSPWPRSVAGGRQASSLARPEAVEQLARLVAEIPGIIRPIGEAREITDRLVGFLPKHDDSRSVIPQFQIRPRYSIPRLSRPSQLWLACFVLAAAVLVSAIVHGGFTFGIGIP